MGLSMYGFAFFIFILACLFALLCKYLFGRTKTHLQSLDEKEKRLLAFYSTLEDMMDEFNDSAVQANAELAQNITAMRNVAASLRTTTSAQAGPQITTTAQAAAQTLTQPPAAITTPQPAPSLQATAAAIRQPTFTAATRPRNTSPVRQGTATNFDAPIFEVITDMQATVAPPPQEAAVAAQPDRPTRILTLHKNGMDRLHIAKELSVTLSEVDLVLGIARQR